MNNNNDGEMHHLHQNQDKVWFHLETPHPEEDELILNGISAGNKEVFRLRKVRKEKKKREILL